MLLVEAKAHTQELDSGGKRFDSNSHSGNHESIGEAIRKANADLNDRLPGWNLDRDHHYQVANRFALAWKLASLGVPVVLVFLGVVGADEMKNGTRESFSTHGEWEVAMSAHTAKVVPEKAWGTEISAGAATMVPLIRSVRPQFLVAA
ncbi:MAG: hypothetical protein SF187_23745 [Deltaproteobacteria bacterium]|nr:hypothetical protein [Deltaproteobacteria bacterium]